MASTIYQSDTTKAKSFGGRIWDYCQNGNLFAVARSSSTTISFYYSTNRGITWTLASTTVTDGVSGSANNQSIGFFIDKDDYAHLIYHGSTYAVVYRRGTPNTGRTDYTWSSPIDLQTAGSIGVPYGGLDVVAHREGTGWVAHCVWGETHVSTAGTARHILVNITSGGSISLGTGTEITSWGYTVGSQISIDFHHETADPKAVQGSAPHIYIALTTDDGAGSLQYARGAYSAGSWSGVDSVTPLAAATDNAVVPQLYYDGTRIVITYCLTATNTVVSCLERNEGNTTTTARTPTALADGGMQTISCGYDNDQNIWIFAQAGTSFDFKKIRYLRSGGTWAGSWTVVEAAADGEPYGCSVARGIQPALNAYNQLGVMFTQLDTSPDSIKFDTLVAGVIFEAVLQGVGTMTSDSKLAIAAPQTTLQGVGTFSSITTAITRPDATLQGVGNLSPNSTLTPFLDFTVFDGYLAGDGLSETMGLIYFEGEGFRNTEESQPLRPPRSDIGNEPTEVRPESGEIFSQQDFQNGAGQLYFHHEGRDIRRYLWSEGFDVDIDTVGRPATLLHLHDVPAAAYTSTNVADIVIFNDLPFVIDGTSFRAGDGTFPGAWTAEDPHASETATTIQDATSSGEYLYAALSANGIHRRDLAGAWTHWSDVQATRIAWVKNRIIAADGQSIYEVISAGAAPAAVETLPVGWTFQDIFEVSGFVYAIASNSTSSLTRIHAYGLNEGGTAIEKKSETPFPNDQLLLSGVGYLDTAFIGGGIRTVDGGYDPVVYQAVVVDRDRGALSYSKITEGEGAGAQDLSVLAFEPVGENVLCGWSLGSGFPFGARDGLALYKLKNGAFFPHLKTSGAGAGRQVRSIATYKGRVLFTTRGGGLYYEDTSRYVSSAYLVSSVADWNTTAEKVWDTIQMSHNPLPAGTTVSVDYTTELPTAGQWIQAMSNSTTDSELAETRFTELSSRLLAIRIRSFASSDQLLSPSGHGFLVRSNVLPDEAEWRLTRYVRILKRDRKDTGGEDIFIPDTHTRKRDIQLTTYKWVTLYEPGVVWTARMAKISNVTPLIPKFEETTGEERSEAYVMQLTLEGVRD